MTTGGAIVSFLQGFASREAAQAPIDCLILMHNIQAETSGFQAEHMKLGGENASARIRESRGGEEIDGGFLLKHIHK